MRKYFIPSSRKNADFILTGKIKAVQDDATVGAWLFSHFTLYLLPTWGTGESTRSFSLTDKSTGRIYRLSDVHTKYRLYFGLLMMPVLFASDTHIGDAGELENAWAQAIEEAADFIYNPNSKFYEAPKKIVVPALEQKPQTSFKTNSEASAEPAKEKQTAVTSPASPAKQKTTPETDLLW